MPAHVMRLVLGALVKAVGQLADPAVLLVLAKSVLVTLLAFAVFGVALYFGLVWAFAALGWSGGGFAEATMAALVAILAGWFLFRVVALFVLQLFADEIVTAVEQRYYPKAALNASGQSLRREIANGARAAGRTLIANAVALPLVAVLWFTGIGPPLVFLLVNAFLLGRELTEMAWFRQGDSLSDPHPVPSAMRFALGAAIAGLMLVPGINLIAPVIGAAAGTHVLHRRAEQVAKREQADG